MTIELITIRELLRDPEYRKYFTTVPKLPDHYTPDTKPWKLMVQFKGEHIWKAKRFGTYVDAFKGFKKLLPKIDNAAIVNPALSYQPPVRKVRIKGKFETIRGRQVQQVRVIVWKPKLEPEMGEHHWCPYCRRPSIFRELALPAKRNHGFIMPVSSVQLRCIICGTSERLIDIRNPLNAQQWDESRMKI